MLYSCDIYGGGVYRIQPPTELKQSPPAMSKNVNPPGQIPVYAPEVIIWKITIQYNIKCLAVVAFKTQKPGQEKKQEHYNGKIKY